MVPSSILPTPQPTLSFTLQILINYQSSYLLVSIFFTLSLRICSCFFFSRKWNMNMLNLNCSTILHNRAWILHLQILWGTLGEDTWISLQSASSLLWSRDARLSEVLCMCCSFLTLLPLLWRVPLLNPARKLFSALNVQHKCFWCLPWPS